MPCRCLLVALKGQHAVHEFGPATCGTWRAAIVRIRVALQALGIRKSLRRSLLCKQQKPLQHALQGPLACAVAGSQAQHTAGRLPVSDLKALGRCERRPTSQTQCAVLKPCHSLNSCQQVSAKHASVCRTSWCWGCGSTAACTCPRPGAACPTTPSSCPLRCAWLPPGSWAPCAPPPCAAPCERCRCCTHLVLYLVCLRSAQSSVLPREVAGTKSRVFMRIGVGPMHAVSEAEVIQLHWMAPWDGSQLARCLGTAACSACSAHPAAVKACCSWPALSGQVVQPGNIRRALSDVPLI